MDRVISALQLTVEIHSVFMDYQKRNMANPVIECLEKEKQSATTEE